MAGLSSPGIGSGLDINGLITKLMEVEKAPLTKLDKKEADFQAKLTAFGTLKGALSSFQTAVRGLSSSSKFNVFKASAADASILTASTSSIAKPGNHAIEVGKLAQAHKIASQAFSDPTATIGTGTLTIDFGTYNSGTNKFTINTERTAKSITIDSTNNSLAGIRDAINQAGAGVTASLINDGSGYRLVLSGNEGGAANSIRIKVSDASDGSNTDIAGLSQLAYDPEAVPTPPAATGNGKNLEQKIAAQNAELTIDGIAVSKSSNTISDAIPGVTLNLLKQSEIGKPTTLTIARDPTDVKMAVEGFVKAYNDLAKTMKDLGSYDLKTKKGGLLLGDSTLRGLQSQLRDSISQRLDFAGGDVSSLSDIGISFQRDGTLALDSGKLNKVLADPAKNVAGLFAVMGTTTDSLVSYAGSSTATSPGKYGLDITRLATRGTATASVTLNDDATKTTVVDSGPGKNNSLKLKLNGIETTVTLSAGIYTRNELVAELQSKINSDSSFQARGYRVSVAHTNGVLSLTSALYGSGSSVTMTGGDAAPTLFGSATSVSGVDVAGEIGGVAGVGNGQVLTGAGNASGLQLLVEGGSAGNRGTVDFSRGIAWQLNQTLTRMLSNDSSINSRTSGIDSSIKNIGDQRDVLNRRLTQIEKRYRAQFNALDKMVASMQQTSSYLTQQLANLSNLNKSN